MKHDMYMYMKVFQKTVAFFFFLFHLQTSCPGCINQLRINWDFLQPLPVFQRIFYCTVMDDSGYHGQMSTGKTDAAKTFNRMKGAVAENHTY